MFSSIAWAQAAGDAPSGMEQFLPFIIIFVIFYFLIIRPQQGRYKKQAQFVSGLKKGDQVLTSGGILGTIEGLTDKYVTLEIADDVRIRIIKSQISSAAEESK